MRSEKDRREFAEGAVQGVANASGPQRATAPGLEIVVRPRSSLIRPSKIMNMYTLRHCRFGARRIAVLAAKWNLVSSKEARDELNLRRVDETLAKPVL